ncbi:TVP38/TMEM64 family protein [Fredinandcohnia humi]
MKKGITFFTLYGMIVLIAFLNREPLWEWLQNSDLSHLPYMFFLAVLFGVIPVIPFSVFAGLMGAKYGVLIGTAINWTGSVGASAIIFLIARYLFVDYFRHYVSRFTKIQRFDEIINQNAFVAVLFVRMIPIVPPPVVNVYSGLSSMLFKTYFVATAIGKVPATIIYAYLASRQFHPLFLVSSFILGSSLLWYSCIVAGTEQRQKLSK